MIERLIEAPTHRTVVRVSTERFKRGNSYFSGKALRFVKKLSSGYNILDEEASMVGYYDMFESFHHSLEDLEDGLYILDYASVWRCWETGHTEPEGLKLTPYVHE